MIELPQSPNRDKNQERYGGGALDETECAVCAKPIKNDKITAEIHVHGGWGAVVTEDEAAAMRGTAAEGGDMGMWPVGSDCLRKHPELKPYVQVPAK